MLSQESSPGKPSYLKTLATLTQDSRSLEKNRLLVLPLLLLLLKPSTLGSSRNREACSDGVLLDPVSTATTGGELRSCGPRVEGLGFRV